MAQSEDLSNGQIPLKGVVLCCTSLPQDVRTRVTDAAVQMGAVHKLDLTSDVTHLIVGNITTPKYRYVASDRPDIKVLQPTWIDAVRESWMQGGDVDVEALQQEHKTPAFMDLHICVTGFESIEQRNEISMTAQEHGATYHGDLTKTVTHLIARVPEGAKYKAARSWGLNVVSLKWFEESLFRGMALEEKLYDPDVPEEKQGDGAFKRLAEPRKSLGKHAREAEPQDSGRKKLRRTASSRLQSQSQDMWQDISAQNVGSKQADADQWGEEDEGSVHVSETTADRIPAPATLTKSASALVQNRNSTSEGMFAGAYILIHGFEPKKADLLRKYLEPNGGRVVKTTKELEDASSDVFFKERYLLIPHSQTSRSPLPDVPPGTIKATEWWVERCVHYKRMLDPANDPLSQPLTDSSILDFSGLLVSTTGFVGVDLRQIAETVKLMGASYQEMILPTSSVLISGSTSIRREKAFYAKKHHIPVVSADWLWTCLQSKKRLPFEKFLVPLPALDANDFSGEPSTSSPAPSEMQQSNGTDTGKAKDPSILKRLSNTRSKHAYPSLSLHASKNSSAPAPKARPALDGNDDEALSIDSDLLPQPVSVPASKKDSQPLQEVSPNLSPRKTGNNSKTSKDDVSTDLDDREPRTTSHSKPASPPKSPNKTSTENDEPPQQPPNLQLNADLAELMNRAVTSKPTSAAGRSPEKRKNRPLGRAPSGISNRSNSSNLSPALHADTSESFEADGFHTTIKEAPLPPSTQLGYETPEAEAHRLQLSKKMGMTLQDEGNGLKRLASVGTVKDSTPGNEGVGGRVRGKQRAK